MAKVALGNSLLRLIDITTFTIIFRLLLACTANFILFIVHRKLRIYVQKRIKASGKNTQNKFVRKKPYVQRWRLIVLRNESNLEV